MLNLNKLILVESEMKGPKGHFLDNLIETTKTFEKKLNISWLLNEQFDNEGTYIPNNINTQNSLRPSRTIISSPVS